MQGKPCGRSLYAACYLRSVQSAVCGVCGLGVCGHALATSLHWQGELERHAELRDIFTRRMERSREPDPVLHV